MPLQSDDKNSTISQIAAVDQVLLQINDENGVMNAGQISNFENVCATDFFPIYLVQVYPSTNYTNITCTVMSQSIFDDIRLSSDDMEASSLSFFQTLAVLFRITSVVTPALLVTPSFADIVTTVVSTYTPELQELLLSSPPEQTYFAVTKTTNESESIESTTDHNYNNRQPLVAIIASILSVAFVILGLMFLVVSRKRYQQNGKNMDPLKSTTRQRMENEPSSSGDSVYLDQHHHQQQQQQQQQQPKATIASRRLNDDDNGDDFDDEELILEEPEQVIYEKMSLTSHRSQHERRTYNMSFIGLSSTTSGVSSVTNAPSSICTGSTTMISTIGTMPSTPGTMGAYTIATRSPAHSNTGGGCSSGLLIPPIVERLYYETLHGTLRFSNSTATSLSSPTKRGDPYSGILSLDDDDDDDADDDDEDDTFDSTDDMANIPPPSLVVAITEQTRNVEKTTTKSKSSSSSSSSSSATAKRQGGGGGGDDQNIVCAGDASSQKERDSIPSVDSTRQPPAQVTEKSSLRSITGTRSQPPSSKLERRVKRALSIVASSKRGGSKKMVLATSGQEAQQQQSSMNDSYSDENKNSKSASDDEKARIYSHTSEEEMIMTDDDTEADTKLPSIIITITQQEITKSGAIINHPPHPDDSVSYNEDCINNVTMTTTTTTKALFSNRSMSINSHTLHGGEIIQSVETELSSVSASLGTVTRNGSSSSGDDSNDTTSNNEAECSSESNKKQQRRRQQSKDDDDDNNDDDDDGNDDDESGKRRRARRNRIVNI
jgi:hypothetical protein